MELLVINSGNRLLMIKHAFPAALLAISITFAAPASARNVTADVDQISGIMKEEGLQAKLEEEDGKRYIVSGMSGYTFVVRPYGCDDEGKDCKWVQFRAAFAPQNKPSLQEVNDFAADNFFGRFYVDKDADPVIEMDIDLEAGGMSRELFVDNIAYWDFILSKFGEFVFSKDK